MKEIPLTQGKFALVDDEDFEWLSQWKWCLKKSRGGLLYAMRTIKIKHSNRSYFDENRKWVDEWKTKIIFMHREIIKTPKGMDTDHIDGNTLDNRRDNLRSCSRSENLANQKISKNNTSGYKGVRRLGKKWQAIIGVSGKYISIGSFFFKEDAAAAYNRAAQKYHGEFARPNSIDYKNLADMPILGNK